MATQLWPPTKSKGARSHMRRSPFALAPCRPSVKEHITRQVVEVGNRAGAWRAAAVDAELAFLWWKRTAPAARPDAAAA